MIWIVVFFFTIECRLERSGYTYKGTLSTTRSGATCQAWDADYPHQHSKVVNPKFGDPKNHCRSPDKQAVSPWCYTLREDIRWDYCDVPFCRK